MKLWVLYDPEFNECDTGAGYLFVARAASEQEARELVAKSERRKMWADADATDCEELTAEGEAEIIACASVNP